MIANTDYPLIESILGPVTVYGHTWNVGDRVLVHGAFGRDILGTIIGFWRTAHPILNHNLMAKASCDDLEVRVVSLALETCFLGLGDYAGDPNKPDIQWYEQRIKERRISERESVTTLKAAQPRTRTATTPKSVTPPHRSAPITRPTVRETGAALAVVGQPIARSVVTIGPDGAVIPDHPGFAPAGKNWCKCENCKTWFLSARTHTKTCSAKCRKALSRKGDQ